MSSRVRLACVALALTTVALFATPIRAEEMSFRLQNGSVVAGLDERFGHVLVGGSRAEFTHLGHTQVDGGGRWIEFIGPDTFLVVGVVVFTAANGDELYASFAGVLVTDYYDYTYADLTLTFNGGIGRFADATGSAEFLFAYDPPAGYFGSCSIEGTIDY
jgi:hypothetical protein